MNSDPSPGRGWPRSSGGVSASRHSRKYFVDGGRNTSTIIRIDATPDATPAACATNGSPHAGMTEYGRPSRTRKISTPHRDTLADRVRRIAQTSSPTMTVRMAAVTNALRRRPCT